MEALQGAFVASYERANPDMNRTFGYDPDPPLGANRAIGSNQVGGHIVLSCEGVCGYMHM